MPHLQKMDDGRGCDYPEACEYEALMNDLAEDARLQRGDVFDPES
jgi:hypothetical protein